MKYGKNYHIEWQTSIQGMRWVILIFGIIWGKEKEALKNDK